ncbi:MAG: phosphatase PAP2 family protein [Flavobacteriaceae bacterium]|nr:phosphatase PAP2 family protein [Flavobacteriaceae bacterium]
MKSMLIGSILVFFVNSALCQVDDSPKELAVETSVERFGDYAQYAPTAVSLITIIAKNDKEGFWQLSKSVGANLTATWILKYAIDKPRPEGRTDGHAFPSGHTSFAFQGASFLQRRYGWEYGIPAYLVACYVGYSRLEGLNDRHDGWDVVAGAIVGIGSTYLFTTPYMEEHFDLTFRSSNGSYSLGVVYKF